MNDKRRKSKKYDTSELIEDQYEPGSGKRVLKNILGINRKREMDRKEAQEQLRTLYEISLLFGENHSFTAQDICDIHKIWFSKIYSWAGEYRQVNISKGGFSFATAKYIPSLMDEFEKNILKKFTPCRFQSLNEITHALAVVHTELVLLHPFREGNGRLARLLSIVMCWQAQLPTLDFGGIIGKKKNDYFSSVRSGVERDYKPMTKIFDSVIRRTLKGIEKR